MPPTGPIDGAVAVLWAWRGTLRWYLGNCARNSSYRTQSKQGQVISDRNSVSQPEVINSKINKPLSYIHKKCHLMTVAMINEPFFPQNATY